MLNELYQLSEALKSAGIAPTDWHKDLRRLPGASDKKPCLKIIVNAVGAVANIQTISPNLVKILRKWEPSNGNSFPGFNIQPLYRVIDDEKKKLLKKWREKKASPNFTQIRAWCTEANQNWNKKMTDKMQRCLQEIPRTLLDKLGEIPGDYEALNKVIDHVGKLVMPSALETYVWAKLESGNDISTLLPVLVHEGNETKSAENDRGGLSVFIDVQDWIKYPVAHERTMQFLNECLLQQRSSAVAAPAATDAYGLPGRDIDREEKLPEVKLPVLGGVKLRAMNKESSCQFRYGAVDAASFPVGMESRRRFKGALEWLSDPALEGQTWGRADGKELLFAYPANVPPSPPKLAACLGARKEDDKSARFAEYAKDVIGQLKGIHKDLKQIELHVFSLRKMDKARTKVVFHRNYSAARLEIAAQDWQRGCSNLPLIRIPAWGEKKGEVITVEPETPFPLQVAGCLNRVWKMDGGTECEVTIISPTAGIDLLLGEKITRYVPRLLSFAIQNGKGLFLSLGDAMHKGECISLMGYDKQKQLMPAILGLLLHKSGIEKERYMMNAPYLIGNMLKVSDDLHGLYCNKVRGGKLPPQLLGNALMVAALESPIQALSQLALRIAPYLGWARTNSTDAARLSRYFLKCYGEIEAKLRGQTLPTRLNDADRAQLLLGYIASSEKAELNNDQGKGG
ncbi:MAG: hypothetical protein HYV35_01745 [Lentisphaerae bacterium]|nr:hypothetical protein [Lentisphaerota bacterium]